MDYYCKECEAEVFVSPTGVVQRNCTHHDATIVAERASNLFGEGGATGLSLYDRAVAALNKIIKSFT